MQEQNSGPWARHAVDTSAEQLSQPQIVVLDPQMLMQVQGTTNKPAKADIAYIRKITGILHIVFGVIVIILVIAFLRGVNSPFPEIGISASVNAIIAGVSGIIASSNPSHCTVITTLVLSVFCCILMGGFAIFMLILTIWIPHIIIIIMLVAALVDLIIAVTQSAACCKVLCCTSRTPQVSLTQQGHTNGGFVFSPTSLQGGLPSQIIPMTTNGTTIPIHIDGAAPETGIGSEEMCYQDIATYDSLADDSLPSYKDAMATNTLMATNVSMATNASVATNPSSATNASMAATQTDAQPTEADLTSGEHVYQGLYSEIDMSKL